MDALTKLAAESKRNSPSKNMAELLDLLPSTIIPEPDKYYTFIYRAKTRGITYDAHPVVAVGGIFKWGFVGYNFHWGEARQYSWGEVISNLYEIEPEQLQQVLSVRTFKRKTS